ncbi:MAG: hypothetical protein Q6355_10290 [Candidatus Brocadiales bacterium]|nr:hypothetical protein [Candidatus Brocadiales bacterium]
MKYQEIITIEPGKRWCKPCIRGMRITVFDEGLFVMISAEAIE